MTLTREAAVEAAKNYNWYHCIDLGGGESTQGWSAIKPIQAQTLAEIQSRDLTGQRVLDIGCFDGLFSFEAEKRGASYVLGIDNSLSRGAMDLLIPYFQSQVEMRELNLYDLIVPPADRFDFVVFAGVLYHLRFPNYGLKRIADAMKPGATLVIETAIMFNRHEVPLLYCPRPEDSPYEPTSVTFFNHLAMVAALESLGFVDIQCKSILCEIDGTPSYPDWEAFLAGPHGHMAAISDKIVIGRGTYTCRRAGDAGHDHLTKYWFGTHTLNGSDQYPA